MYCVSVLTYPPMTVLVRRFGDQCNLLVADADPRTVSQFPRRGKHTAAGLRRDQKTVVEHPADRAAGYIGSLCNFRKDSGRSALFDHFHRLSLLLLSRFVFSFIIQHFYANVNSVNAFFKSLCKICMK